ncbi:MAG TPA: translation initiation factor IF-2, partial [Kofleriaceae bacterium]|nr:translation initiation factor IF-2 [Kofleriaceae bacterium]
MTGKMRVYEIAKEVGIPNKELISKIRALGLEINNHMSSIDPDDVARIKRSLEKERLAHTETKRLSSTVLRRRSSGSSTPRGTRSLPGEDGVDEVVAGSNGQDAVASRPVARRRKPVEAAPPEPQVAVEAPPPPRVEPPATITRRRTVEVVQPEPAPDPEPPPRPRPEPTPAPEPAPITAEPAKPAAGPPSTPAIIAGPRVVSVPGRKPRPRVEPIQEAAPPAPEDHADAPPVKEVVVLSARDRFEAELARARERVEARESEPKEEVAEPEVEPDTERDPARPAVGSVISLPVTRIKITERAPTRAIPGQGQIRGRFEQARGRGGPGGRGGRDFGRKGGKNVPRRGTGKQTQITTPAEHKRIIRMQDTIAIPELAKSMGIKANEVLRKLWSLGMMGININATIDFDTAQLIAAEFGYEVQNVAFREEAAFVSEVDSDEDLQHRAPVVTIMGHVDHGKTSLLDSIRTANVTRGEAGGITQHIAAYRVSAGENHGDIVFLDTPGHEAFTEMRARGAQATDIVVLVCAANDGVMPQTIEALNHAKDAGVQIIVAINKIDLPDANPDRVRQQLADHGLIPEAWGGDTLYVEVSALKKIGIEKLLETIALTAELLELRANPDKPALGVVVEARLDRARGPMATVLVQEGTLRIGEVVVAGEFMGKVRAMLDDQGQNVKEAGPSMPVELLGLDGVPLAGETVNVADDEKVAKQVVEHRREAKRRKELASTGKISLENIMERISEGAAKELKVVLKTDVQGSAEALKEALQKASTPKVSVKVIQAGVGGITESDVNLAKAGGAIIIGFHVRPAGKSAKLADQEGVDIKIFDIIYEAIDAVRLAMAGLLAPIKREQEVGKAEVRDTFTIPKLGTIGGCMVLEGKIVRKSLLRVIRESIQVYEGKVGSLRRFKEDVGEVKQSFECGIMVDGFNDL